MVVITVRAIAGGWVVDPGPASNPLVFLGGATAERKARELAELAARGGEPAELHVHDRSGGLIGRFLYQPARFEAA